MTARFGPRFGAESAFIVAVAIATFLLELPWPGVAAAVFGAWLLVVIVEVVASRPRRERAPAEVADARHEVAAPPPPGLEWAERATAYAGEPAIAEGTETGPAVPEAQEPEPRTRFEETTTPPGGPFPQPPIAVTPSPPPAPAAIGVPGRAWNLWELERRARERAGQDPLRDEEWSFLLMYLREFADADGNLPAEFDSLVRESFGELLGAPR